MNIPSETRRESSVLNEFSYYITHQNPQTCAVSNENSEENQLATSEASNLQLFKKLGEGNFGQVWEATYNFKPGAAKLFKKSSPDWNENMKQEINMLLRLDPKVGFFPHYIGRINGGFVMELINGSPLSSLIYDHSNSVTLLQLQRLAFQLTAAVTWLHENGILHCDIKPNNVLVSSKDTVKLIDFGLARMANEPQRIIGGTITYLAPEIHFGESQCTEKSDVYSLGCTFWAIQTGHKPWHKMPKPPIRNSLQFEDNTRILLWLKVICALNTTRHLQR